MIPLLIVVSVVSVALLILACLRIESALVTAHQAEVDGHTGCTKGVLNVVSVAHEVKTLRLAADHWDTPSGQYDLKVLALRYETGGPSLAAIWLRDRAEKIEEEGAAKW